MNNKLKEKIIKINNYLAIEDRYEEIYPGAIEAARKIFEMSLDIFKQELYSKASDFSKLMMFHEYMKFSENYNNCTEQNVLWYYFDLNKQDKSCQWIQKSKDQEWCWFW